MYTELAPNSAYMVVDQSQKYMRTWIILQDIYTYGSELLFTQR